MAYGDLEVKVNLDTTEFFKQLDEVEERLRSINDLVVKLNTNNAVINALTPEQISGIAAGISTPKS